MAWSQLGYKLYCFKQWYSPLTKACITQFQWLWVKYILIKMCKKWYPTEGEGLADFQNFSKYITSTAKISKSKSLHLKIPQSKSPHFFHVSHFPNSPHSPYFLYIISIISISPHLLCGDPQKMAEKMRNSAKDAEIWGKGIGTYISA